MKKLTKEKLRELKRELINKGYQQIFSFYSDSGSYIEFVRYDERTKMKQIAHIKHGEIKYL